MNELLTWINCATNGASRGAVAAAIGVHNSTYNRQYASGHLNAHFIVAIARHYGADPLEGLIAGGYITPSEAGSKPLHIVEALHHATNDQLLHELYARLGRNNHRQAASQEKTN
ncbi:hypothetical protein ACXITP_06600 [Actinotignum sanguinis]|uniref:hypothetical protein n=1 Tax=Actinotignum sanguinis TaxID=1445614 RepID=UPI00237E774F|nr:hypothetical protein [Actinotignum sanguinis]MDE1553137.1 hypothetical protein [Actinotignum sanguinis]MDE1565619.1 hypothetical protein [Actinotignum sanguinis]MDE1642673.1 hypothetical protein [Actinotignum sanguinis]MDK8286804.1 hypothetical protein [Actinotignum sanguinis]MDK8352328.1 hypothetical protein [Actinotignum sanguinis]